MSTNGDYFEIDLAMMDDDALIVLAQECCYAPARDELLLRYESQRERLISWLARTTSFSSADVEDARQNSVFWTVEAISKYDTEQISKDQGCSFYSFLNRVLVCRFKDYSKHVHRRERHIDRSAGFAAEGEAIDRTPGVTDPALLAESHESVSRLHAAVAQLDAESCCIWEMLTEGSSLREIAAELGLSYDAVKRRRRRLIDHLRQELSPKTGS